MTIEKFYPADAGKNPDMVLEQAVGVYDEVLIIGHDKEGDLDVRSNTQMTAERANWLIDRFKRKLVAGDYLDDDGSIDND